MTVEPDWPPFKLKKSRERVEELSQNVTHMAESRSEANQYILSELSRLLVVRCSGHLEVTFSECFLSFVSRHSRTTVSNYVSKTFKAWQNPKPENISKALEHIDPVFKQDFRDFIDANGGVLSSDIGSMVSERCKVSHGDNDTVTFRRAKQYCESALTVSDWIIEYFKPNGNADASVQEINQNPDL